MKIKIAKVKINEKEEIVCMTDLHDAMTYENLSHILTQIQDRYIHIISELHELHGYAHENNIHITNLAQILARDARKIFHT